MMVMELRIDGTVWTDAAAEQLIGQRPQIVDRQIAGVALELGEAEIVDAEVIEDGAAVRVKLDGPGLD